MDRIDSSIADENITNQNHGGLAASPQLQTCDRRDDYHLDLKSWQDTLNQAIKASFPKKDGFRYRSVHVLLLSWEEDDLDPPCAGEIQRLEEVFQKGHRFDVEEWRMPSDPRSHRLCGDKLNASVRAHEHRDVLLIVYDAGHGSLDRDRQCIWHW